MGHQSVVTRDKLKLMIMDEAEGPKRLPFRLLVDITDSFSDKQKIGTGGSALVYKGDLGNSSVAVKKLSMPHKHEKEFIREIQSLEKVKHKNIIRCLGYCYNAEGYMIKYQGKAVMAGEQELLICFPYLAKGSLDKYITDASSGLEWSQRYQIINGICQGLHRLHQGDIFHLDLKPENILLDDDMVPKIADFGLSRCLDENQSKLIHTNSRDRTLGYRAPEYINSGVITNKNDLYSLGVIIMKVLIGNKDDQLYVVDEFKVLESWMKRLGKLLTSAQVDQIKECARIGIECIKNNPNDRPPDIKHIIDRLEKMEKSLLAGLEDQLIQVEPPELRFPDVHEVSSTLKIRNTTDHHVAFSIWSLNHTADYKAVPNKQVLSPHSSLQIVVTRVAHEWVPADLTLDEVVIVKGTIVAEGSDVSYDMFDETKTGRVVQLVEVNVVFLASELISKIRLPWTLDVHPTEPWIMMTQGDYHVRIWNYETRKAKPIAIKGREVTSAKFIVQKQWIIAGCSSGLVYVYGYDPGNKNPVKKIRVLRGHSKAVNSLVVHATEPYMLSGSEDGKILIWDYGNEWKLTKTFHAKSSVKHLAFNLKDTNTFASAQDKTVKIWDLLHSDDYKFELTGHSDLVLCLDYFSLSDKIYLITGSQDKTAKIWDCELQSCVQTLKGHTDVVNAVCFHPDLQLLITGSYDGSVRLWDLDHSTTFRHELKFDFGEVYAIASLKRSTRIAIGSEIGFALVDIDLLGKQKDGDVKSTVAIMELP